MESPRRLLELFIVILLVIVGLSVFGGLLEKNSVVVASVSLVVSIVAIYGYMKSKDRGLQLLFRGLAIISSIFWILIGLTWFIYRKNIFAE